MANSGFWYYPFPTTAGTVVSVDLGRTITGIQGPYTAIRNQVAEALTGHQTIVQFGGRERLRITQRWGGVSTADRLVRQKLVAMINHLQRGGHVIFAEDTAKLWGGSLQLLPATGATVLSLASAYEALVASVDLDGREIVLRSSNPTCAIEMLKVASHVPSTGFCSVDSPGTIYDYQGEAWVSVRDRGTWPALRLPRAEMGSTDLLSPDHEISFVLDLPLEEDEVALEGISNLLGDGVKGTAESQSPGLETIVHTGGGSSIAWSGSTVDDATFASLYPYL